MSTPHRIDLTAAWEPPGQGGDWTRSFGRPGGLTTADRVWLVLGGAAIGTPELNGVALPPMADRRWDVTGLLRRRNRLVLRGGGGESFGTATARMPLPAAIGAAWLEIDAAE